MRLNGDESLLKLLLLLLQVDDDRLPLVSSRWISCSRRATTAFQVEDGLDVGLGQAASGRGRV